MKLALVHNYHRSTVPSGEDVVVDAQIDAFRRAGHQVLVVAEHNDAREQGRWHRIDAALSVATGYGADPLQALLRFRPDVVHVHNLFPFFGTRWLSRWRGPLVATLHNFRPMCAAGTLLRDGRRCTDCRSGSVAAVRHRCFSGSLPATLPLAIANRRGATRNPLVARADRLITISERAADEYVKAGVDRDRIAVVPNALPDPDREASTIDSASAPQRRWIVVARLSAEKGIDVLLDAWPPGVDIDVVGSGEDEGPLRQRFGSRPGVRFLGYRSNAEVRAMLPAAQGLVVPSLWAEAGPPLTYVEALAAGLPVIAVAGNGAADDIAVHGGGAVIGLDRDRRIDPTSLAAALAEIARDREALCVAARDGFDQRFSTDRWVQRLLDVYTAAGATPPPAVSTDPTFEGASA